LVGAATVNIDIPYEIRRGRQEEGKKQVKEGDKKPLLKSHERAVSYRVSWGRKRGKVRKHLKSGEEIMQTTFG